MAKIVARLESYTERKCCKHADKIRLPHIKLNLMGRRGWPDRVFLGDAGRTLWIEFKRQRETPRKLQEHIHKILRGRGHLVAVVDNWQDGIRIIDDFHKLGTQAAPRKGHQVLNQPG